MKTEVAIRTIGDMLKSPECVENLRQACSAFPPERLVKVAEMLYKRGGRGVDYSNVSLVSFYNAMVECATIGLEPILGRVYFIPYGKDIQLIIGYQGLLELARRGGVEAKANAVFEGDEFVWESGFDENIIHKPNLTVERNEKNLTFVYCVWKLNGEKHVEVMSRAEVEAIRNRSKASTYGPWGTHFVEMAKKTVVRRAAKYWPLTFEVATVVAKDDERTYEQVETASASNALRNKLGIDQPNSKLDEPEPELVVESTEPEPFVPSARLF